MEHKPEKDFNCVQCGANFDRATAVQECRICERAYCKECLNEQGICIPCSEVNK